MPRIPSFLALLILVSVPWLSQAVEPEARNPRVLFIIDEDCPRCDDELARLKQAGGAFDSLRARGWKIGDEPQNHVQIIDRSTLAEQHAGFELPEYPAVACIENGEIVRSFKDGCTTPLDAWTFGFLLKGVNERPKASVPESARVKTTGSYPLRGNHWSVDGDFKPSTQKLISHLRGPNHGHQIAGRYAVESWSYEELRSLHDDLHEREMANGISMAGSNSQSPRSMHDQFSAGRKALGR